MVWEPTAAFRLSSLATRRWLGLGVLVPQTMGVPGSGARHSHMGHKIETLARCASADNLCRLRCLELIIVSLSLSFFVAVPRPKGQHSAPRGGPPRSWTNTELTEALQHVWNKKMTTSQASRIFGIPYNSLLMYVRGKYGKSLKLEQLRKDCISGPPIEMLQMGISGGGGGGGSKSEKKERKEKDKDKNSSGGSSNANSSGGNPNGGGSCGGNGSGGGPPSMPHPNDLGPLGPLDLELGLPLGPPAGPRSGSSEPDLLGGHNALFNPFNPQGFYPDFAGGFPGLPLSMLNLLPPAERHHAAVAMHHLGVSMDEDCKSVGSKQSSSLDDDFAAAGLPLSLEQRRHSELASNGGAPMTAQANGAVQD